MYRLRCIFNLLLQVWEQNLFFHRYIRIRQIFSDSFCCNNRNKFRFLNREALNCFHFLAHNTCPTIFGGPCATAGVVGSATTSTGICVVSAAIDLISACALVSLHSSLLGILGAPLNHRLPGEPFCHQAQK